MKLSTRGGENEVAVDARMHQRVELHPATDRWMMGDRFGQIVGLLEAPQWVQVKLDTSGARLWFEARNVMPTNK